jgi:membrane protease YdiL (CAAX protease family)
MRLLTETHPYGGRSVSPASPFLVYVIVFHLAWIGWPFIIYPRLTGIGETTLLYAIVNVALRLLIWVLPVWLYIRLIDGVDPLHYLKLRRFGRGAMVGIALTVLNLLGSLARFGVPHVALHRLTWNAALGTSLLVGLIEEIPYRGFILQKLEERIGFQRANLITSILFVSIHLPGWMALHALRTDVAAAVFILSIVFGLAFRYSGSLWAAVVTHSGNDFLSFVIFSR